MYNSDTFLDIEVVKEVLSEYKWPLAYKLEEYSDEVIIEFPKCTIILSEGFESGMNAYFLNSQTGRSDIQQSLELFDALWVLRSINRQHDAELKINELASNIEDKPSLEKVKQGLHIICVMLQAYLLPCIEGDFSRVGNGDLYPLQHYLIQC